jgi:hypothetical protein
MDYRTAALVPSAIRYQNRSTIFLSVAASVERPGSSCFRSLAFTTSPRQWIIDSLIGGSVGARRFTRIMDVVLIHLSPLSPGRFGGSAMLASSTGSAGRCRT